MKPLLITLFLVANVLFITQSGRRVHQLLFSAQPSVFDQFKPKEQALSEKQTDVLVADYRAILEEIHALNEGKKSLEGSNLQQENQKLAYKRDTLWTEISNRENRSRELRDLWLFSGFAVALILVGAALYRRSNVWTGLGLLVSGFGILGYWSWGSEWLWGSGSEWPHPLLVSKTLVTLLALVLLYGFWWLKDLPNQPPKATP